MEAQRRGVAQATAAQHTIRLSRSEDAKTIAVSYTMKDGYREQARKTLIFPSRFISERYNSFISETDLVGNITFYTGATLRVLGRTEGDKVLVLDMADKFTRSEKEAAPDTFILLRNTGFISMRSKEFAAAIKKKGMEVSTQLIDYDSLRMKEGLFWEARRDAQEYGSFKRIISGTIIHFKDGFTIFAADSYPEGDTLLNFRVKVSALDSISKKIETAHTSLTQRRTNLFEMLRDRKVKVTSQKYLDNIRLLGSYEHTFQLNANLSAYYRNMSLFLSSLAESPNTETPSQLLINSNTNPEEALLLEFKEISEAEKRRYAGALAFVAERPEKAFRAMHDVISSDRPDADRFAYSIASLFLLSHLQIEDRTDYSNRIIHVARRFLSEERRDMLVSFARKVPGNLV